MPRKRVLVIGVGSIGERHVRCFAATGRVDVSICENQDALRQRVAAQYRVAQAFAAFEAALDVPHDLAVICTPAHLHIPMALRLAERGVHLLIEKPLSVSPTGIERLAELARQNSLTIGVAYVLRAHPVLAAMREAVLSGRFGRPVQLVATSGQHFPFFRPAYRQIYYKDRATGGGAIQDALTHVVNAGEWLLGPITELAADADHQVLEGVDVEDTVHLLARHGRVQALYSLNQHQAMNENTLTVICERGAARLELHRHRWRWATQPENHQQPWTDEVHPPLERDELFVRQAHLFLDAVEQSTRPPCTLDEGWQTLRVNLAVLRAADTRAWQTLPSPTPLAASPSTPSSS